MKGKGKYINIMVCIILGLIPSLQAQTPSVNYLTKVGSDSVDVYWAYYLETTNANLDSLTYVFSLENANAESPFYKEVTVALILDSVLISGGQIGSPFVYEYIYSSNHTLPLFDTYYTHITSYNGNVYDRVLGSGVNYYYDKLEFNEAYPKYNDVLSNPNGFHYHLFLDSSKYHNIQPVPNAFAYTTRVNGAPVQNSQTYTNPQQYAQYYWNTAMVNPMVYQPSPSVFIPNSNTSETDTIILSYPDTILEHIWLYTWNFRHDEVLYYPVYDEEICTGDEVIINGNLVDAPGLYLEYLTTTMGTDSLVGKNIRFKPMVYSDTITSELCNGDSYLFNDTEYTETGVYTYVYGEHCDSAHVLNLTVVNILSEIEVVNDILMYSTPESGYTYQWINLSTDTPISGETSEYFQPLVNGLYALEISDGNCTVRSEAIAMALGLEDLKSQFTIAPNPFLNNITLQFNEIKDKLTISISNAQTQTVLLEKYSNTSKVGIQGSHLEAGIYYISIFDGKQMIIIPIIKQ